MASRAAFAAVLLLVAIPMLAQTPVYPNYPPPPPASGENAPHPQQPDQTDQGYPDQSTPGQSTPDRQGYPNQTPQKPSPYPPNNAPSGTQPGQEQAYPQQSAPAYPAPENNLNWVPQGMGALARTAAFHTDVTFDRSLLRLAGGLWGSSGDPQFAAAMNRLDGISVHTYHYAAPGMYDPRLLEAVRRQYSAMGWQHLVTAHPGSGDGATDLWISFHNLQATGAVVLFRSATNLDLIAFSGNLSPVDMLHLRGHFGIPRFPGDRFVPAPGPAARVAPPLR